MTDVSEPPRARPGRQALLWAVKILVSGGLLFLLLRKMDLARLVTTVRTASLGWLASALAMYLVVTLVSAWRWQLLCAAQKVPVSFASLTKSYLVATFANNFLPSNIGGDVFRIADTAKSAGSKTLATMIVLVDRGIGLLGLVFVAAVGTSVTASASPTLGPIGPSLLWATLACAIALFGWAVLVPHGPGALLKPLRALHQEWVGERLEQLTTTLSRFRDAPLALVMCLVISVFVQGVLVVFYAAIARGLHVAVPLEHLAIMVPVSFIILMLPISVNGLGLREATFGFYLTKVGVPLTEAVALSFVSAVLIMIFSLSGAVAYLTRK